MVVRLDLHQRVRRARARAPYGRPSRDRSARPRALHHRRIVRVRDDGPARVRRVGVADHPEQAIVLRHAVDRPRALKILWRQCSEFACANIMSSTSVGSRPSARSSRRGSRSRRGRGRGPLEVRPLERRRGPRASSAPSRAAAAGVGEKAARPRGRRTRPRSCGRGGGGERGASLAQARAVARVT